jgi:hypothetical protein
MNILYIFIGIVICQTFALIVLQVNNSKIMMDEKIFYALTFIPAFAFVLLVIVPIRIVRKIRYKSTETIPCKNCGDKMVKRQMQDGYYCWKCANIKLN